MKEIEYRVFTATEIKGFLREVGLETETPELYGRILSVWASLVPFGAPVTTADCNLLTSLIWRSAQKPAKRVTMSAAKSLLSGGYRKEAKK